MYSTCIFCNGKLGANEAVEHFPVGRRLAFDAAKGRLWVVCARCARWNLTPLEERWEAIEECERLFGATRLRTSTDNIGVARLREGLELVRIGAPQRPEFAAWRYGRQFVRRLGTGLLVGGGIVVGGSALAIAIGGLSLSALWVPAALASNVAIFRHLGAGRGRSTAVPLPENRTLRISGWYAGSARVGRSMDSDAMELRLLHADGTATITGDAVVPALAQLLATTNAGGAAAGSVGRAVRVLEAAGGPDGFLDAVSRRPNWSPLDFNDRLQIRLKPRHAERWVSNPPSISMLPLVERLALEMAANEERERAALEGELHDLERAWRDAEEIAGIADELLLPGEVSARMRRLRDGGAPRE